MDQKKECVSDWENKCTETSVDQKWKEQENVKSNPGFTFTTWKILDMGLTLSFSVLIWLMGVIHEATADTGYQAFWGFPQPPLKPQGGRRPAIIRYPVHWQEV